MSDTVFLILILAPYAMCFILAWGLASVSRSAYRRVVNLEKRLADLEQRHHKTEKQAANRFPNATVCDCSLIDPCPIKGLQNNDPCKKIDLQKHFGCRESEVMDRLWGWQGVMMASRERS